MKRNLASGYKGTQPELRRWSQYAVFESMSPAQSGGFTRSECERIINVALTQPPTSPAVARSLSPGRMKYESVPTLRSATVFELAPSQTTKWVYERILKAVRRANQRRWQFELSGIFHPLKVIRYEVGDHYTWHTDVGAGLVSDRKLSVTAQLSAPNTYAGGDLEIVVGPAPIFTPRARGTLTVFPSYQLHRVTPIRRGVRWALVTWIQGSPFR